MRQFFQFRRTPNIMLDGVFIARLRGDIEDLFTVTHVFAPEQAPQGTIVFRGDLHHADSEEAYDIIAERWQRQKYTPMLRRHDQQVEIVAHPSLFKSKPGDPRINLLLFVITFFSVFYVGAATKGESVFTNPLSSVPYTFSLLGILLAHEFGHFFAAKYHQVSVSLPYFIPVPFAGSLGTLGAFIRLHGMTRTRNQLFDIGVAGPLVGLIVTLPILIIGLINSAVGPLEEIPEGFVRLQEGNSILYWSLKYLIFGQSLPSNGIDVTIDGMAWAGWLGLFVTMINLLPAGQLDGGHVVYVLFGEQTRRLGMGLVVVLAALGFLWTGWILWAAIIFFLIGVGHPPPLNDLVPLGKKRRILAFGMVAIFILLFMPAPLTIIFPS